NHSMGYFQRSDLPFQFALADAFTICDAYHCAMHQGRMGQWPKAKQNHSMGYFQRSDLPFQFALADAFTICDAYHCAM
ncbi:hypothetical protein C7E12_22235, partial [Stenotrophomonas maltophilia]